jgi:hypothetical protein
MSQQMRQGDVLLVRVADLPQGVASLDDEAGRVILAHGEVTGHAHAVSAMHACMYAKDADRYLKVETPTQLTHEEHSAISLDPGVYKVIRQREYVPQGLRFVAD